LKHGIADLRGRHDFYGAAPIHGQSGSTDADGK
jgi:hypothetical protein